MNMNQKGFANVILVLVIVMLVGAVGYFAFVKKSEPTAQQLTPTPIQTKTPVSPTPTTKDEAASWKTYSNTEYGFEFKYPVGMTLGGFENVANPKLFTFWIDYQTNKDLLFAVYPVTAYENLAEYRKNRGGNTAITLGNQIWYRFDVHSTIDYVQYYLERRGNLYRVDLYDSKNENVLKQILSTFKFTN